MIDSKVFRILPSLNAVTDRVEHSIGPKQKVVGPEQKVVGPEQKATGGDSIATGSAIDDKPNPTGPVPSPVPRIFELLKLPRRAPSLSETPSEGACIKDADTLNEFLNGDITVEVSPEVRERASKIMEEMGILRRNDGKLLTDLSPELTRKLRQPPEEARVAELNTTTDNHSKMKPGQLIFLPPYRRNVI